MRRRIPQPGPTTATPTRPLPIVVTLAATSDHCAYNLRGPFELAHRAALPSRLGASDGLLVALTKALEHITPSRKRHLENTHKAYESAVFEAGGPRPTSESELLVEIRTESEELVAAGPFIRSLLEGIPSPGGLQDLAHQLKRFDGLRWVQLPASSIEIRSLERWACNNFRPGLAALRHGIDRRWSQDEGSCIVDEEFEGTPDKSDSATDYDLAA